MHMAYWYPTGATLTVKTDYLLETTTANRFFLADSSPATLMTTATLTNFEVDAIIHTEFIIGATGVDATITCTLAGTSTPPSV